MYTRLVTALAIAFLMGLCPQADLSAGSEPDTPAATPTPKTDDSTKTPLHKRIDRLIDARAKGHAVAENSSDAEFLRRIYLDLAGRIPASSMTRKFLADQSPDKRRRLIEKLLNEPTYARRMTDRFNSMLNERRGEDAQWMAWLYESFKANKPWDQMARQMLSPDARSEKNRAAAYFMTSRLKKVGAQATDYPGLTRDVGRMMLGVDLQCAQCHNHLTIVDYKQVDFQGMFTVFRNINLYNTGFPAVEEKVMTRKIEFVSVLSKGKPKHVGPRLPFDREIEIKTFEKGKEFEHAADKKKKLPGVPKFSAVDALAGSIVSPDNDAFARNIANRLWFIMMGRGLVEPMDLHHSDNPPSHPELLDLLARQIVDRQFDIKWFVGQLALTRTYQRSSRWTAESKLPPPHLFVLALEKHVSAEQMHYSVLTALGELDRLEQEENQKQLDKLRKQFVSAMANAPKEPELAPNPSLKGALYVMNDPGFQKLVDVENNSLGKRLMQVKDFKKLADELYLSVLSRYPDEQEAKDVIWYLEKKKEPKGRRVGHLIWALLASAEFGLNH